MKEAHKMTREIVNKYGVDYKTQFGLCLAYLLNNKEESKVVKVVELKGSEKQVAWAEKIRAELIEKFEKLEQADINTYLELNDKLSPNANFTLAQTNIIITRSTVQEIKNYILENKEEAKWYIETGRNLITPIIQKVYIGEMLKEKGIKVELVYQDKYDARIKELF